MATGNIPPHDRPLPGVYRCSFCGEERDAARLFAGTGGAYICDTCVEELHEQVEDRRRKSVEGREQPRKH